MGAPPSFVKEGRRINMIGGSRIDDPQARVTIREGFRMITYLCQKNTLIIR